MKYLFTLLIVLSTFIASAQSAANALQFDGSNDQVVATVPAFFNNISTTDFTMEAWVKPQGAVFSRIIYAQASTTNFATMSTSVTNNIYFYVVSNGTTYSVLTNSILPSNTWTHVACRWTAATQQVAVFFNGVLQNTTPGGSSSTGTSGLLTLGTRPGGSQNFPGTIDEVRIWSEARSNCEILNNHQTQLLGTEPNLVTYYNFNHGVADGNNAGVTTLVDLVAANNGTLTNFTLSGTSSNWTTSGATINTIGEQQAGIINFIQAQICQGDTYTFNSQSLTTSGVYSDTLVAMSGCDSIVELTLTVTPTTYSSLVVSSCDSYTWPQNGETYTASGNYNDTIPNAAGCDSVITLNLTILNSTTSSVSESACASYTWPQNGETYTTSGTYNDTIPNVAGCDSIITLDLTIIQPTSSLTLISECDSYTWTNGTMYSTSGIYSDTLVGQNGCDSIAILDLTILESTVGFETATSCGPYFWPLSNSMYNVSGWFNWTLQNAAGCDSIITLDLTVNAIPTAGITFDGMFTLMASGGTVVAWIDCSDSSVIAGETGNTFSPSVEGEYAVIVENGSGCSDTSSCQAVYFWGVYETELLNVSLFPNPASDFVSITFEGNRALVIIYDGQGKEIRNTNITSGESISLSELATGIYHVSIETNEGRVVKKIIKE